MSYIARGEPRRSSARVRLSAPHGAAVRDMVPVVISVAPLGVVVGIAVAMPACLARTSVRGRP
jgi:hypothetical protein